jgi:hypothetical protein
MPLFSDKDDVYYLDREDRENFLALVADLRRRGVGKGSPPASRDDDHLSPEIYVARTPSGGIPALGENGTGTSGDDVPGSATCQIYRVALSTEILTPVWSFSKKVYNLNESAVLGDKWILVVRDKYGDWFHAAGALAGARVEHIKVTSDASTGGYYPGVIRVLTTDTTWGDGEVVKVLLAAGDTFVVNGIYDGVYRWDREGVKVFSCVGCDQETLNDCDPTDSSIPGTRVWKIKHPWEVGAFVPD